MSTNYELEVIEAVRRDMAHGKRRWRVDRRVNNRLMARIGERYEMRLPQDIQAGDRIHHFDTLEYLGTACATVQDAGDNPENPLWEVYLDGGSIGRYWPGERTLVFPRNEPLT